MNWLYSRAHRWLLAAAGAIVAADFILPSGLTLFFDELLLFGAIAAMRWVTKWQMQRPT